MGPVELRWYQLSTHVKIDMVPVVHSEKNMMVPVVHLDITGWSQLSTYVKNGMVPVVHGNSCPAPVDNSDHRGQRVYEGSALAVL